ncbi:MAG TPA: DUF465 domain-containing protein [Rhizomicrobium sp.]|jgi:hypothetical protein|nr:DUF465 domain-containing protein [Rhizomicrobium sp.]
MTGVVGPDEVAARAKLAQLTQEHRDLDAAIEALSQAANPDLLQLSRLKKRKLQLKDEITEINNGLLPDIIA